VTGVGRTACRVSFILWLCVWLPPASAQDRKPLPAVPSGNFQFEGTWDCAGSMGNGKTHKSVFTGSVILDGKWLELTERDIEPATGYLAKYLIGYDSQQKRLVEFDANNFGAATYSSADGWVNGVLTMTSPVSEDTKASYAANRFLYSIAPPDSFTMDWQIAKSSAFANGEAGRRVLPHSHGTSSRNETGGRGRPPLGRKPRSASALVA